MLAVADVVSADARREVELSGCVWVQVSEVRGDDDHQGDQQSGIRYAGRRDTLRPRKVR
jgi:hypothetical protein